MYCCWGYNDELRGDRNSEQVKGIVTLTTIEERAESSIFGGECICFQNARRSCYWTGGEGGREGINGCGLA